MSNPKITTLTFKSKARPVKYGDGRVFFEYDILMFDGKRLAGAESGPRCSTTPDRSSSMKAARARIRVLKSHRLFPIRVTRKHISDGTARSCSTCAISQALWHNQESMGFPKYEFRFEVSPYGAWVEPRGITLSEKYGDEVSRIPAENLPEIVYGIRGKRVVRESMLEFAMTFDEWAEARYMTLREWREEHGWSEDRPCGRPGPCSFVLDLDALKPHVEPA